MSKLKRIRGITVGVLTVNYVYTNTILTGCEFRSLALMWSFIGESAVAMFLTALVYDD